MKRRLLASIMTLVMMLSMLPTAVWAADTGDESDLQETEGTAEPTPQSSEEGTPRETATSKELDLDDGSIVISEDGYTQGENSGTAVDYVIKQSGDSATTHTITVVSGDHAITLNGVNIDVSGEQSADACAFDIQGGDVTVVLDGTNVLKSGYIVEKTDTNAVKDTDKNIYATGWMYAGLSVEQGASVTISAVDNDDSKGSLEAIAATSNSVYWANAGKAAGIGASCYFEFATNAEGAPAPELKRCTIGEITISGGTIEATGSGTSGGYGGPGIGGGSNDSSITITGGDVTANAGYTNNAGSAGIGSAYSQGGIKTITISGGTVNATGGSAGIGGGAYQGAGVILIGGGSVTAESKGVGAGIGGGGGAWADNVRDVSNNTAMGSKGVITIKGGFVSATGSAYGAGIGGGGCQNQAGDKSGAQASGDITIEGGVVTAKGGLYGPGIGSGAVVSHNGKTVAGNSGKMGTITISGGSVEAKNGDEFVQESGESTGNSYKVLDDSGDLTADSGIGQGMNASDESQEAFAGWTLKDGNGETIIAVEKFSSDSVTYTRNGGEKVTVEGADNKTVLYLPEGYYSFDGTKKLIATAENRDKADEVKNALEAINTSDVDAIRAAETKYNALRPLCAIMLIRLFKQAISSKT